MQFEWDEKKNIANQLKHGIAFEIAKEVFEDVLASISLNRQIGIETREQIIGKVSDVLIFVVFTRRSQTFRIISARKADKKEREQYVKN